MTFITNTVGPFTYLTETVAPGETKFADAVVGDLINESKWRIFVTATQGSVTETREFEKNISFTGVNPLYTIIFRVLLGLVSLLILAWTIRVFKTKKNSGLKQGIRWRRKRNKDLFESSRELIATLEARILEAEARSRAQTRKPKRKVVKKVATRTLKSSKRTTKTTKRKKTAKKVAAKR